MTTYLLPLTVPSAAQRRADSGGRVDQGSSLRERVEGRKLPQIAPVWQSRIVTCVSHVPSRRFACDRDCSSGSSALPSGDAANAMVLVSSDSNANVATECRMFECISISLWCWVEL